MMDPYSRELALRKEDCSLGRFSNSNEYLSVFVYLYFKHLAYILSNAVTLQSILVCTVHVVDNETEFYVT